MKKLLIIAAVASIPTTAFANGTTYCAFNSRLDGCQHAPWGAYAAPVGRPTADRVKRLNEGAGEGRQTRAGSDGSGPTPPFDVSPPTTPGAPIYGNPDLLPGLPIGPTPINSPPSNPGKTPPTGPTSVGGADANPPTTPKEIYGIEGAGK